LSISIFYYFPVKVVRQHVRPTLVAFQTNVHFFAQEVESSSSYWELL